MINSSKILITGGAGFIGSHLCDSMLEQGEKIICLDNFDNYYSKDVKLKNIEANLKNKNFKLIEGSILDKNLLKDIFNQYEIATVIHLAAQAGVRPSIINPEKYFEVNVDGTLNILKKIIEYNSIKFIFASSSSVYGINKNMPYKETDALLNPVSPYASSKISAESICRVYAELYDIQTIILRFFTVYGPRQRPDMAIHKFVKSAFEKGELEIFGDGQSKRDYTFISDIIDGIHGALEYNKKFEIFNLGNSNVVSLIDVINLIKEKISPEIKLIKKENQKGDVPITCSDINKAGELLNYSPSVSFDIGLGKFIDWYKKNNIGI